MRGDTTDVDQGRVDDDDRDYFSHIATQLGVRMQGFSWIASLIAALQPGVKSDRAHASFTSELYRKNKAIDSLLEDCYHRRNS